MEAPSVLRIARDKNADVYPEYIITKEQPSEGEDPRHALARILTSDSQFAKMAVNLFWSKFMTVGIVDPPFDWDLDRQDPENPPPAPWTIQPSHPKLLDALARYFQENNHSLRRLMRVICSSKAYQLSSRFEGDYNPKWDRYYARKLARRLSAEELYDAMAKATNVFGHGIEYMMDQIGPPSDPELRRFLNFLGQGDRDEQLPDTKSSIIQASMMLNSDVIRKKVLRNTEGSRVGTLLDKTPPLSNMEIVEELYMATLCRPPTVEEIVTSIKHVEEYRGKAAEDLQWAMINKLEFMVNY